MQSVFESSRDAKHVHEAVVLCLRKGVRLLSLTIVGGSCFCMLPVNCLCSVLYYYIVTISLSLGLSAGQGLFPALGPEMESAVEYSAAQDPYSV